MKPKSTLRSFLAIASSSLLAMSSASALTYYWDGTSATWNDVVNWSTDIGGTTPDPGALPLVTDDLIFNITGANSLQNITLDAAQAAKSLTFNTTGATNCRGNSSGTTARILTLGSGGITLASGAGAVTIGEAPGTYGAVNIFMDAAQTWSNSSSSLLSVTGNVDNGGNLLTIGSSGTTGPMSIGGVISGGGGITVTSKTRLVLSGANEFTGAITVNGFTDAGTIAFTSIADFGSTTANALGKAASGSIILGNGASEGRLEYIGSTDSESNRTIEVKGTSTNGGQIFNNGTGKIKFDAATFNTNNGTGAHSLLLSGSNTGDNEISGIITNGVTSGAAVLSLNKTGAGKWILSGGNTYGGTTTASGTGKLILSGANTPGASATVINDGGELVLDYTSQDNAKIGTGTLSLNGGTVTLTGGSHAQTVASTSLGGTGTFITRSSGGSSLNLGAFTTITRGSSLAISADSVATSDRTNTNGILGGNFVVGNNWAVNSTNLAAGAIVGLSTYTALPTSGFSSTTNYSLTGSLTLAGSGTVNSLKIIASADGQTLNINTRNLLATNIGNSAGYLFTANDDSYTYNITGTGFMRTATANQDTFFFVNNGTLNMTADTGSGTGSVIKAGSGTLILGGDSSTGANWGGALAVQQGTLRLTHNNGAGQTGGGITVQNLAALELGNSVAIGAEILTITGTGVANAGALRNVASNTSSYAGAITIGVNGARINSDASGSLTLTAGIVTAAGRDVTIGGAGNTTVSTAAISGAGGLIKDGAGTTTLSFANTYTGATSVNGGTLELGVDDCLLNSNVEIGAGTLKAAAGVNDTVGTLDPTAAATIDLGDSVSTLAFAASNGVDWTGGTLNITGAFGSGASLKFGTDNTGLTAGQLLQISATGWTGFGLDASGFLTAIPDGGGAPEIGLDQGGNINTGGSKAFGTVTIGSPTSLIFTINNTGTAALNLTGTPKVAVSGDADFTVTAQPAASVAGPGNTTFTVQFAPSASGARNAVLSIANNDATGAENPFIINVSGTGQTPYEAWALGGAFDADANGDGVKNGLAFLLGAAGPSAAVTLPTVTQSGGNLVLSNFSSRNLASRGTATLSVQHSSDLGIGDPWTTVLVPEATAVEVNGVSYNITSGNPLNTVNTATISVSQSAAGKLFGRLKATQP